MLLVCFGLLAFALGGAHAQGCPPTPLPCSACACELDSNYLPTYYCNNMGLTTIPTCFSPETSLIDLSNNQITEVTPQSFPILINLAWLYLGNNSIASIGNTAFGNVSVSLLGLDLQGNQIHDINLGTFMGLTSLIWLNLELNPLGFIEIDTFSVLIGMGNYGTPAINTFNGVWLGGTTYPNLTISSSAFYSSSFSEYGCGYSSDIEGFPLTGCAAAACSQACPISYESCFTTDIPLMPSSKFTCV
eukprot:m.316449 g.316449  ORF g.316449 m.316449 type:complete len:246 (+) comp55462_c0_seq11:2-739(+)